MTPLEKLLPRLQGVRERSGDQYEAFCPVSHHSSGDRKLAIRELEDGRLLIRCRVGCSFEEVLAAVGLEAADLFPESPTEQRRGVKPLWNYRELLQVLHVETLVVMVAATRAQELFEGDDWQRLRQAFDRISKICELAR